MILFIIQRTVWLICWLFWKIFFHLEIKGKENVLQLKSGNVIFVANHMSMFDSFLLGSNIPKPYFKHITGLKLLTHYKFIEQRWYGPIIRLIGAFPVYPGKDKDFRDKLDNTIKYLRNNYSIVIFPHGKRSAVCDPKSARPGVAYLAKTLDSTIVPVLIKNSYKMTVKDLLFKRRKIGIIYGSAFKYSDVADNTDDYLEGAQKIMKRVCSLP